MQGNVREGKLDNGLFTKHAYSIAEVKDVRLVLTIIIYSTLVVINILSNKRNKVETSNYDI